MLQSGMSLTCNIDSRGRLARLIYGIVLLAAGGVLVAFWAIGSGSIWRWAISLGCIAGGAFAIFESRKGWCVIRAMGLKTPM